MYKLGFLAFVVGVVLSTSVTCDVCDEDRGSGTPNTKITAVGAAPDAATGAIPKG
jgi:hypothetical protein